jgi:hypothetical protein
MCRIDFVRNCRCRLPTLQRAELAQCLVLSLHAPIWKRIIQFLWESFHAFAHSLRTLGIFAILSVKFPNSELDFSLENVRCISLGREESVQFEIRMIVENCQYLTETKASSEFVTAPRWEFRKERRNLGRIPILQGDMPGYWQFFLTYGCTESLFVLHAFMDDPVS